MGVCADIQKCFITTAILTVNSIAWIFAIYNRKFSKFDWEIYKKTSWWIGRICNTIAWKLGGRYSWAQDKCYRLSKLKPLVVALESMDHVELNMDVWITMNLMKNLVTVSPKSSQIYFELESVFIGLTGRFVGLIGTCCWLTSECWKINSTMGLNEFGRIGLLCGFLIIMWILDGHDLYGRFTDLFEHKIGQEIEGAAVISAPFWLPFWKIVRNIWNCKGPFGTWSGSYIIWNESNICWIDAI